LLLPDRCLGADCALAYIGTGALAARDRTRVR
jgi:hypothetical protein